MKNDLNLEQWTGGGKELQRAFPKHHLEPEVFLGLESQFITTFICGFWFEDLFFSPFFLFNLCDCQKAAWTSFIWTNFKAYCYALSSSRCKMPHFFLLVIVINSLSIDPECSNLWDVSHHWYVSILVLCQHHYIRKIRKGKNKLSDWKKRSCQFSSSNM